MTNRKKNLLTKADLKARGWTDALIQRFFADSGPKRHRPSASGVPILLCDLREVEIIEASPTFASEAAGRVRRKLDRHVTLRFPQEYAQEADAFIDAWRWLWRKLPLRDRRRMVRYWRAMRPHFDGMPLYVEILAGWVNGNEDNHACTTWEGCAIYFHGPTLETMDDEALPVLIAHELAHCFQWAHGLEYGSKEEKEQAAIEIATRWGFDEEILEGWELMAAAFGQQRSSRRSRKEA